MTMPTPLSYHDVIEACTQPGCPLCTLAQAAVDKFLDALMYEDVNDPDTRDRLRRSLGYCNEHAWRLPKVPGGAALGVAIIYLDLLNSVRGKLSQATYQRGTSVLRRAEESLSRSKTAAATEGAVRALQPVAECPACEHRGSAEDRALIAMLDALAKSDERMQAALIQSSGMCLVHLRRAFELARDEGSFVFLRDLGQGKLAELAAALGEFIRKNDYRFAHEGFGDEGDSWLRAIAVIVGAPGVR